MEYFIDFLITFPDDASPEEKQERMDGEIARVAELADQGHALRVWRPLPVPEDERQRRVWGLYRADSEEELQEIVDSLPLRPWFETAVTPLQEHPNDPARRNAS